MENKEDPTSIYPAKVYTDWFEKTLQIIPRTQKRCYFMQAERAYLTFIVYLVKEGLSLSKNMFDTNYYSDEFMKDIIEIMKLYDVEIQYEYNNTNRPVFMNLATL